MQIVFRNATASIKLLDKCTQIHLQPVRYTRKPRWLPKAPSKMFRVPPRPQISTEERNELFKLFTNYRTFMKAIYKQLEQDLEKSFTGQEVLNEIAQKEEKEWQQCLAINDNWNVEVALARDERIVKEKEIERQKILGQLISQEEEKQKRLEIIEERVRIEKEKSRSYITKENIDVAIEKALDNIKSYNYAIDLNGTKLYENNTMEEVNHESSNLKVETIQ